MPVISLSSIALEEKNKLATDSVMLIALQITIPGVSVPIRVVRDSQDLTWLGETWLAFPFELDEIGDNSKGEVPQINIRVGNVNRVMEAYLQAYDAYTKANGFTPIEVEIYVVNTKAIAADPNCAAEVTHVFELKQPKTDPRWATFVLGASNPFGRRFPQHRMLKNHCRFVFGSTRCGLTPAGRTCNKTLSRCRELGNSSRFGGTPGVGSGGLNIASA